MILISNDFCHKRKMYNFKPYNVLLSFATNIAVLLMTAFVLQGNLYNEEMQVVSFHGNQRITRVLKEVSQRNGSYSALNYSFQTNRSD